MQCCAGKKKTKERCMRKMMGKVLRECTYNTGPKEQEQSCRRKQMVKKSPNLIMKMSYIKRRYCHESHSNLLEGP